MTDRIDNVGAPQPSAPESKKPLPGAPDGIAFERILADRLATSAPPVHFSGHALERIQRRGINLDTETVNRLGDAVTRAAAKGSRSSLVLLDSTAYVVSVPNRTVITAVDDEHMKEHVFTNIDSAVFA